MNTSPRSSNEWQNTQQNNVNLLPKLVRDFAKKKLHDSDFNDTYTRIISNLSTTIDSETKMKLDIFKASDESYIWLDISWISNFELAKEFINIWNEIMTSRKALKELFERLYTNLATWTTNQITLFSKIDVIWQKKINDLLNSEVDRKAFLNELTLSPVCANKEDKKLFEDILHINFDSLSEEEKTAIKDFYYTGLIDEEKFFWIINNFTDISKKKALLEAFMPTTNLQKLLNFWIISDSDANRIIKDYILSVNPTMSNSDADMLLNLVTKSKFIISTKDFIVTASTQSIQKLFEEERLKNLFHDARKIDKIVEQQAENTPTTGKAAFIEKMKNDYKKNNDWQNSHQWIGNIENFWENMILEWSMFIDWMLKKAYILIERIEENWNVKIKNLTHDTWNIRWMDLPSKTITYENLDNMFSHFIYSPHFWKLRQVNDIKEEINSWQLKEYKNISEIATIKEMLPELDAADDKWQSFWMKVWTVFEFEANNSDIEVSVCRVKNIDETAKTISITNFEWGTLAFREFIELFKENKCKRTANITNNEELFSELKKDKWVEKFKETIYDKDTKRILPKHQEKNKDHPWIKYLVWPDKKSLRIDKIEDWRITATYWEFDEKWWKDWVWSFTEKRDKFEFPLEGFYALVKKLKLEPLVIASQNKITTPASDKKLPWSFSFVNMIMSMPNWLVISASFKWYADVFKQKMKDNTELQTAEFMLKMWNLLPSSMRSDYTAKAEWIQKNKMKSKIESLEWMTEPNAMIELEKILIGTSNSNQHEIEAALMFTVKKYWVLYPWALYPYKKDFYWYKRLWGEVDDALFQEIIWSNETSWKSWTEEELIEKLLKKQWNKELPIKRRSTIWKEFAWNWASWRKDNKSAWKDDVDNKNTRDWREWEALDALKNGKHVYLIWTIESTLDKWWKAEERCKLPFMVLMSWITKKMHEKDAAAFWGLANKYHIPILSCAWKPADVDMFERIVIKIAERTDNSELLRKAKEISEMKISKNDKESEIIDKCEKLWTDHAKELTPLLMTNSFKMKLWSESDTDIKDYFWKISFNIANDLYKLSPSSDDARNNNTNGVFGENNACLAIAWGAPYLKKAFWQQLWKNRWPKEEVTVKLFESSLKMFDKIKDNPEKLSEEERMKSFIDYNTAWVEMLLDAWLYHEDLEKQEWWKAILEKSLWIPWSELNKVITKSDLKSELYRQKMEMAYHDFIDWKWIKRINEIRNRVKNVKLRTSEIIWEKYTKAQATAESKKIKNRQTIADLTSGGLDLSSWQSLSDLLWGDDID